MTIAKKPDVATEGANVDAINKELTYYRETPDEREQRMAWWREAKFGMFIHWGVYAVPAGSYGGEDHHGEWIMRRCTIPVDTYRGYAAQFDPVNYDPDEWVRVAKAAGMRYIVITAKHHDGFALFPSAANDWNVADASPYGRDLIGPLVDSARKAGLKIGLYYSQAQDWCNPGGAKAGYQEGEGWDEPHKGSFDDYLDQTAIPQIRELIERYAIDILWWDTPTWMTEERARRIAEVVATRPGMILNNRLGGGYSGDTETPEQFIPITGCKGNWETCMTLNGHWGYNAQDDNWKSSQELIHKLCDICAKGGNFLLNVGPDAVGDFPPACTERLLDVGRWLEVNGEAVYGSSAGPFPYLSWGRATRKGDRLFLHIFDWPANGELRVPLRSPVKGAHLLAQPDESLTVETQPERVVVALPETPPHATAPVVVLELAAEPVVMPIASHDMPVRASSTNPATSLAALNDGDLVTYWEAEESARSAWLEIDFLQATNIHAFAIDEPDRWPRYRQNIRLEGEVEGEWQELVAGTTGGHGLVETFAPATITKARLRVEREADAPGIRAFQLYAPE